MLITVFVIIFLEVTYLYSLLLTLSTFVLVFSLLLTLSTFVVSLQPFYVYLSMYLSLQQIDVSFSQPRLAHSYMQAINKLCKLYYIIVVTVITRHVSR